MEDPHKGLDLCEKINHCVGLSQRGTELYYIEGVNLQDIVPGENWTSVLSLNKYPHMWEDFDHLESLNLCCPEQPPIPLIKMGRQEVPDEVKTAVLKVRRQFMFLYSDSEGTL